MSLNPCTRWYWNDWDNDRALALCGLAAQGLWMRMLSIAARAGGYVTVAGTACTTEDIAALVGRPLTEIAPLVAELGARGVFSRTRHGAIYNRRMVNDEKRRTKSRESGILGASIRYGKQTTNSENPRVPHRVHDSDPRGDPTPPIPLTLIEEDSEAIASGAVAPADPIKELWDEGLKIVGLKNRALLGKMRKEHGDVAVAEAIVTCKSERPSEPVSFLIACLSRSPARKAVNGNHPGTYRPGPRAAQAEGIHNGTQDYIERHHGDLAPDPQPVRTLLDGE